MAYQRKRVGQVDDDRVKFEISTVLTRKVIMQVINFISGIIHKLFFFSLHLCVNSDGKSNLFVFILSECKSIEILLLRSC